jgi:hypothetical protein
LNSLLLVPAMRAMRSRSAKTLATTADAVGGRLEEHDRTALPRIEVEHERGLDVVELGESGDAQQLGRGSSSRKRAQRREAGRRSGLS